jgi:hypothetical protein
MISRRTALLFLFVCAAAVTARAGEDAGITINGRKLVNERMEILVGASGLPEQITITPEPRDLPLDLREKEVSESVLQALGRGPQLREPMRVEVTSGGGNVTVGTAGDAAALSRDGDGVTTTGTIKAGPATVKLKIQYGPRLGCFVTATCTSNAKVDLLELVLDIAGPVDTVVAGAPVAEKVKSYPLTAFAVPSSAVEKNVAWQNTGIEGLEGMRNVPGVLPHLFVGNGDRGFTWLTDPSEGWSVDKSVPTAVIQRDQFGKPTLRLRLANKSEKLNGRSLSFALLTHPATLAQPDGLRKAWLGGTPQEVSSPALTLKARRDDKQAFTALRADFATAYEGLAPMAVLQGPAGGDALSADEPHTATYPINLVRYLAGTHTGGSARLKSNAGDLIEPGSRPATDRVLIGRALLLGMGLDPTSLCHAAEGARLLQAIHEFGLFEGDGQTEFLPYWRSSPIIQVGQSFNKSDPFELRAEDILARVHTSCYIRPHDKGKKALIVTVNEGTEDVREMLYVKDPARLFGGANRQTRNEIMDQHDWYMKDERQCDWAGAVLKFGRNGPALKDVEDGGFIKRSNTKQRDTKEEKYGPLLHVPARSFRVFTAYGK